MFGGGRNVGLVCVTKSATTAILAKASSGTSHHLLANKGLSWCRWENASESEQIACMQDFCWHPGLSDLESMLVAAFNWCGKMLQCNSDYDLNKYYTWVTYFSFPSFTPLFCWGHPHKTKKVVLQVIMEIRLPRSLSCASSLGQTP